LLSAGAVARPGAAATQPAGHTHVSAAAPAESGQAAQPAGSAGAPLFDNLGSYHHEIKTASPQAQHYFDQGLRLVYGFNHDEAERAFREAARLDPSCAMAWWGVALTLGPNINLPIDPERNQAAYEAIQKALALVPHASEREAAYIQALAKRYSLAPDANRDDLDRAYAGAMADVSRRYPDDLDAATLYAESLMDLRPWRLWTPDGKPAEGTAEIVAVLESVLKRNPDHPGANHYYIHAVEASPHPERALPSARRLESLVPGAGHLVHMPAHIYMRTGDYAAATRSNQAAASVDEAYIKNSSAQGVYPLMYYGHNLHFLAIAAAMGGESAVAKQAAARLIANVGPAVEEMPMGEFMMPTPIYVALRFQRWDDILQYPEPNRDMQTTHALWRYARALAYMAKGDAKSAQAEREAFAAERGKVPAGWMLNLNGARNVLDVAAAVLEARLAAAQGNRAAAVESWSKAVEAQDALAYDEPPIWYYPVRESLGGELLRAGRFKEAEVVFRADLERNPRNGRSLFGLWKSLEAQKKPAEAEAARKEFEAAWKNADVTLQVGDL
jgi:tetratricopeptide (TPR) repeat protein